MTCPELTAVAETAAAYRRLMKVGCTGCRYCMPCPAGVNIPECFALYNNRFLFPENRDTGYVYLGRHGGIIGNPSYAGLCLQCGKCAKACPQEIPVPDRLREVARTLEGPGFRFKVGVARTGLKIIDGVAKAKHRFRAKEPGRTG